MSLFQMMLMFRLNSLKAFKPTRPSGFELHDQAFANVAEDVTPEWVFDNRFFKQVERELKGWNPQIPKQLR